MAINGGGLCYLENSVPLGRRVEENFSKCAESLTQEQRISAFNVNMLDDGMISSSPQEFQAAHSAYGTHKWLVTNYEAGDVVFHDPYSIHASGRNESSTGRIRLSTDLRFYEKDDPGIDKRWLKIWAPGDGL
jgi:phytanoyl-CoA hydroxylase